MSSLIFAFASIVTHSLFRTNAHDLFINDTSSYLDLSPVYGCSTPTLFLYYNLDPNLTCHVDQAEQNAVRDKSKGRGLLYPDTFSEARLSFLPPATSVLLILFARNHNVRVACSQCYPLPDTNHFLFLVYRREDSEN